MIPAVNFLGNIKFPKMIKVKHNFDKVATENIECNIKTELVNICKVIKINSGSKIAIAVGSRGIAELPKIVKEVVFYLKELGANPFIVPAMGSHGGATSIGQRKVLEGYGISEAAMSVPIKPSMEVVKMGKISYNIPVFFDKIAFQADGIIPINRIKKHTDFNGTTESGLMKMLVIGLGNKIGAENIHRAGPPNFPQIIPEAAKLIIKKAPILFGIAIVENGLHQIAKVKAILPDNFFDEEKKLLIYANTLYKKIPLDADVVIIDEMGKEFSGGGMDGITLGRIKVAKTAEPESPKIFRIVVLNLTDLSKGNASGLGLADYTTKKLVDKIDFNAFYLNELTSAMSERGKIPIALATDRDAISAALNSCWLVPTEKARVIRIKNTMILDQFYISESLIKEIKKIPNIQFLSQLRKISFNKEGVIEKF